MVPDLGFALIYCCPPLGISQNMLLSIKLYIYIYRQTKLLGSWLGGSGRDRAGRLPPILNEDSIVDLILDKAKLSLKYTICYTRYSHHLINSQFRVLKFH